MPPDIATAEQVSALGALGALVIFNAFSILLTGGAFFVFAASIPIEAPSNGTEMTEIPHAQRRASRASRGACHPRRANK